MKNERASYKYINEKGNYEIWKTISRFWCFNVIRDYEHATETSTTSVALTTKRECKQIIENHFGKIYTYYQWRKRI